MNFTSFAEDGNTQGGLIKALGGAAIPMFLQTTELALALDHTDEKQLQTDNPTTLQILVEEDLLGNLKVTASLP